MESYPDVIDSYGDRWVWDGKNYRAQTIDGKKAREEDLEGYIEQSIDAIKRRWGPIRVVENNPIVERLAGAVGLPGGFVTAGKPVAGDPAYLSLLDDLRELHLKKAADYGDGADPLANLRQSVELGIPPWIGCMLRCNDKMQRVRSLIRNGSLANESIEDNLLDMAAYCLLALKFVREKDGVA